MPICQPAGPAVNGPGCGRRPVRMGVRRRAVLVGGLLGGLGLAGGAWWEWHPGPPDAGVRTRSFRSAARGREVQVVLIAPPGVDLARLPVCLALHGRGGHAADFADLGLPAMLADAVAQGMPPYAVVAVDGNPNSYWTARDAGDDPQAMLREELPGWLGQLGLSSEPRTVFGVSMGCFGALVYARQRPTGLVAAATMAPALFRDWPQARARNAFSGEAAWSAAEPLRHLDQLPRGLRLGVWCGEQDPFLPAARELARRAAVASFAPGGHNAGYYRTALPAIVRFLGAPLTAPR
jgi:S-formylglutathione hydrolase FrmB